MFLLHFFLSSFLFSATQNGRAEVGDNRDKFLPRPLPSPLTDPNGYHHRLALYEHVGQWMGVAMRSQHYLPVRLPAVVWKQLCAQSVTLDDVRSVDVSAFQGIVCYGFGLCLCAWQALTSVCFMRRSAGHHRAAARLTPNHT